jgi:hypothetical protein
MDSFTWNIIGFVVVFCLFGGFSLAFFGIFVFPMLKVNERLKEFKFWKAPVGVGDVAAILLALVIGVAMALRAALR